MHAFFQFLAICLGLALAVMIGIATAALGLLLVFCPRTGTAVVVALPEFKPAGQTTTWDPIAGADLRYFLKHGTWPDDQPPESLRPSIYAKSMRPVGTPSDPGASIRSNLQRVAREQKARLAESRRRYRELTRRLDQLQERTRPHPSIGSVRPLTRGPQSFPGGGGRGRHGWPRRRGMARNR